MLYNRQGDRLFVTTAKPDHVNVYDNGYWLIHPIDLLWTRGILGQKVNTMNRTDAK